MNGANMVKTVEMVGNMAMIVEMVGKRTFYDILFFSALIGYDISRAYSRRVARWMGQE